MKYYSVRNRAGQALRASAIALLVAGGSAQTAGAQKLYAQEHAIASAVAAEFEPAFKVSVGEKATYDVEYKGRGVGSASLETLGREMVGGHSTVHASMKVSAGWLFAKVNDQMDSWFDADRLFSRRYMQNQREVMHSRQKNYEIAPEAGIYTETHSGYVDSMKTHEPLDDITMLYFARTLPLKVGSVDTIPRYFKPGHDVIVKVLRRESVTVPAGTFKTVVVQPTITNVGGLFGQGGNAEVYVTDDAQRTIVKVTSNVPVIGSLALTLREVRSGQ